MTPKPILEVRGTLAHQESVVRLGTWKLGEGEAIQLTGVAGEAVARAFLGIDAGAEIRVLGARVGSREARSVMAMAFAQFQPFGSLRVLEHLALAVRIGPPRLGKVPPFREVLGEVGLEEWAASYAGSLDAVRRFWLSLAMLLVRPLPLWVLAPPSDVPIPEPVMGRIEELLKRGGAAVLVSESEVLRRFAHHTRRLDVRSAQD